MNENDKQELLQQLERCKDTLDVVTTLRYVQRLHNS